MRLQFLALQFFVSGRSTRNRHKLLKQKKADNTNAQNVEKGASYRPGDSLNQKRFETKAFCLGCLEAEALCAELATAGHAHAAATEVGVVGLEFRV